MKKHGIFNSDISKVLADLGHTDQIAIGDAGLPIPAGVPKIDLAIAQADPSFIKVLKVVLDDMKVEEVILAEIDDDEVSDEKTWSSQKINAMFTELEKGSSNVSKILMEKTGKSFAQLMGEGNSLADVLRILYNSVGNDNEQ